MEKQAPKIFQAKNKLDVPYLSLAVSALPGFLAFTAVNSSSDVIESRFQLLMIGFRFFVAVDIDVCDGAMGSNMCDVSPLPAGGKETIYEAGYPTKGLIPITTVSRHLWSCLVASVTFKAL